RRPGERTRRDPALLPTFFPWRPPSTRPSPLRADGNRLVPVTKGSRKDRQAVDRPESTAHLAPPPGRINAATRKRLFLARNSTAPSRDTNPSIPFVEGGRGTTRNGGRWRRGRRFRRDERRFKRTTSETDTRHRRHRENETLAARGATAIASIVRS